MDPPKVLFHMNGWSWLMLHNFLNPLKYEIAGLCEPSAPPYLLLSGPRPSTSSSQPRFTGWLYLGISKPSTSSSHLRLLYRPGRVALGITRVGADHGLHHLGNPRVTSELHHTTPTQLILHGGQRLVVNGHSQSLQLTGLGKSLSLICQQQSRLKCKRRVYSAYMKGSPQGPSMIREAVPLEPIGHLRH